MLSGVTPSTLAGSPSLPSTGFQRPRSQTHVDTDLATSGGHRSLDFHLEAGLWTPGSCLLDDYPASLQTAVLYVNKSQEAALQSPCLQRTTWPHPAEPCRPLAQSRHRTSLMPRPPPHGPHGPQFKNEETRPVRSSVPAQGRCHGVKGSPTIPVHPER